MLDNKAYVSQKAFTEIDNNQKETDVSSPEEINDYDGLNEDELTDQLVDDADQMDVVPDK